VTMLPKSRPSKTWDQVGAILEEYRISTKDPCVLSMRGYMLNSMGVWGKNDRGIYDDAAFIWRPDGLKFACFNMNTDPSRYRPGHGFDDASKGMAVLNVGAWEYQKGLHKGVTPAFVQAAPVVVTRDGVPPYQDRGYFGINHHPGGDTTTSSLGCQTWPKTQWIAYRNGVYQLLDDYSQKTFFYHLIERQG
jgi:lysozyme